MIEMNYLDFLKKYPDILDKKFDAILIDYLKQTNQKKILKMNLSKLSDLIVDIKKNKNDHILKNNVILLNNDNIILSIFQTEYFKNYEFNNKNEFDYKFHIKEYNNDYLNDDELKNIKRSSIIENVLNER